MDKKVFIAGGIGCVVGAGVMKLVDFLLGRKEKPAGAQEYEVAIHPDAEQMKAIPLWTGTSTASGDIFVTGTITGTTFDSDVVQVSNNTTSSHIPEGYTNVTVSGDAEGRVLDIINKLGYTTLSELNKEDVTVVDEEAEEDEEQPPNPFDVENNGFGLYEVLDDPDDFGENLGYDFNTVILYANGIFTNEQEEVLDDEALRPLIGNTDFLGKARDLWYVNEQQAIYLVNDRLRAYTEVLLEDEPFIMNKED